ncbi:Asp-tRNA(Asn)/Glu-tRNA(Gln) amidotransferase subunit GatC [Chryseosolibacter indicus]|uniref:Aspartyl/glutamyl-tRNA(Asn/Gln) amidotransferase subunit C n=1 Tax=Chryseosolibacter indicus TaxID=2782351 RepID=A0ABS5VMS2_9BACT|nr:Asp-tRNA(Asn)/Glu-tRNA(Gln) amidotransferase subunit GatC [Chryseosolibacter indicus]MBT1702149.1 Asp-tRNA(Asn)/Glu-tRNA(Gln) amidotransferase subunit GatC [Chryseosolibacter indicus]
MKIDRQLLDKIAHLARLEFEEKDAEKMMQDMTAIVDWVEKLKEVDTTGIQPLTTMSHEVNMLREDEVNEHLPHKEALKNAPKKDQDYFRVPKVLE